MHDATLAALYQRTSKHSHYQTLAGAVAPLLDIGAVRVKARHETERLAYMLARCPIEGLHLADIGGNTGFFSFEMLSHGAAQVDYYEGHEPHHAFVAAAAQRLGLADRLHTHHRYLTLTRGELPPVDCALLLNVLHHLGDDFGDRDTAQEAALQQMLGCLAALAHSARWLIFQMGFNWKGDRRQPLFAGGRKAELIDFVRRGTAADWSVEAIGVAERSASRVLYRDLSARNIARDDSLGEFLNRPIFVLRSRHPVDPAPGTQ